MFERPRSLEKALSVLAAGDWSILSGGTDFYPAMGDRVCHGNVLDISDIEGLRFIGQRNGCWEIGALTTWTDVIQADLPSAFDGLKLAAREVGSVQIQNRATVVGNICNASPAADGVPPLLTLDASVRLASRSGTRELPLSEFIIGNRETKLAADELVTAIVIPEKSTTGRSAFLKLGARKYLVISIAMVAVRIELDDGNHIRDIAIAVGSCSLVAKRLARLERLLTGKMLNTNTIDLIEPEYLDGLSPISDVRGTAQYRSHASLQLIRRTVMNVLEAP